MLHGGEDYELLFTARPEAAVPEQIAGVPVTRIGEITRFPSARHLVGYLGLDPRVRQSGSSGPRHGHISRQGSPPPGTSSVRRPTPRCEPQDPHGRSASA